MQRVGGEGEHSIDKSGQDRERKVGHGNCDEGGTAVAQENIAEAEVMRVGSADASAAELALEVGASLIEILSGVACQRVLNALRGHVTIEGRMPLERAVICAILIRAEERRRSYARSCDKARILGIKVQLKSHVECALHESTLTCSAPKGSPPLQQCNLPRGFVSVAVRLSTCAHTTECIVRLSSIVCVDCGSVEGGALIDVICINMLCMHSLMCVPDIFVYICV